jgi:phospholipase C
LNAKLGLPPLTVRDQTANNLAEVLDFAKPDLKARQFRVPTGPFGGACATARAAAVRNQWAQLREMATALGWPAPSSVLSLSSAGR